MSLLTEIRRRNVHRMAILYVATAWLIAQVADILIDLGGLDEAYGPYVLIALVVGCPIALGISWFWERTPEGLRTEKELRETGDIGERSGRRTDFVIIAVLAAAFAVYVWVRPPVTEGPEPAPPNSIAVLPFANMSSDPGTEYFSDGVAETLLHSLSEVDDLDVVARTSSFAFKHKDIDIREIAKELGVSNVLEGSVQIANDRLRITAQLIRAQDGFHVWSQKYDRTLDDVFDVQDDIASNVTLAIRATLASANEGGGKPVSIHTRNAEAYDFYLRAKTAGESGSYEALTDAATLLTAALIADPGFLDAKIELANTYYRQSWTDMRPVDQTLADMHALSDQVLAVDPNHRGARLVKVSAQARQARRDMTPENWDAQLQQIRDIVDEAPSDNDARLMLAHFLTWFDNKPREAIDVLKSALEVDPLNASIHLRLARAYFNVREMPSARDAMRKSIELEPEGPNAYVFLGDILAAMGDNVAMLENYIKAMTLDPTDLAYATAVAENLYMIGLHEKADQFRARVAAVQPNSVYLVGLGFLRAQAAFDEQLANEKARQLIVEQTDNVFYWTAAVVQLLQSAVVHDAVPDTLAFIDEHAPGFSDLQNPQEKSIKEILAQLKCLNAFRQQRSEQEIDRYIEDLLAFAEAINYVIEDHPNTHLDFLLAREDTKGAIALVLSNHLQRQVAMDPLWRLEYAQPRFAKVVADPRVQEALQRREKEEAEYREDVHAMLERLGY